MIQVWPFKLQISQNLNLAFEFDLNFLHDPKPFGEKYEGALQSFDRQFQLREINSRMWNYRS